LCQQPCDPVARGLLAIADPATGKEQAGGKDAEAGHCHVDEVWDVLGRATTRSRPLRCHLSARLLLSEAEARGLFSVEHRTFHAADRTWRWFQSRATPVRDAEGRILEWFGTSTDIDDQVRAREVLEAAGLQRGPRPRPGTNSLAMLARATTEAASFDGVPVTAAATSPVDGAGHGFAGESRF
jgi:hypothetical protein